MSQDPAAATGAPTTREDDLPSVLRRQSGGPDGSARTTREPLPGEGRRPAMTTAEAVTGPAGPGTGRGRATEPGGYSRYNLPPPLAAEYEVIRELSASGAEADLLLCRPRIDGNPVVVKLYRGRQEGLNERMLTLVQGVDSAHVVRVIDWSSYQGHWWEVQEYVELGSLDDLAIREGPALALPLLEQVLRELAPALDALHRSSVVHRDIKPSNILVRTREPLDLVISDFGLVVILSGEREMRSSSRTSAYAAPEAAFGATSAGRDWWSLGMTLLELAVGQHPFRRPDGGWMEERQIGIALATTTMDVSRVADPRWRSLLRGLLTPDPEYRWGMDEVTRWLAGANPQLHDADRAAPPPDVRPLTFMGVPHHDPVVLAEQMAREWGAAAELIVGRRLTELEQWVAQFDPGPALGAAIAAARARTLSVDRLVARLIRALAPDQPPVWLGFAAGPGDLGGLARAAAAGPGSERKAVSALRQSDGLLEFAGVPGCENYPMINEAWKSEVDDVLRLLQDPALPPAVRALPGDDASASLLSAIVDETGRKGLSSNAQAATRRAGASVDWYRQLVGTRAEAARPSRQWLAIAAAPVAKEEAESARERGRALLVADRETERAGRTARQRPRLVAKDRRLRNLCILLCITGVAPYCIGQYIWLPYFADPVRPARWLVAVPAAVDYAPQIVFGILFLLTIFAVALLLLPPWLAGSSLRRGVIAVMIVAVAAAPWAAGRTQKSFLDYGQNRYRTSAIPVDRLGGVCGSYWTSTQPVDGAIRRYALVAPLSGDTGCSALRAFSGWTEDFKVEAPKNSWFVSLGSFPGVLVVRQDRPGAANQLVGYSQTSGKVKWRWKCRTADNRYLSDEAYHGVGTETGAQYISVSCAEGNVRIGTDGKQLKA